MNPSPETIKFEIGVPQVHALAYAEGKPTKSRFSGDQLMYTTVAGDRFYVDPYFQDRLRAAGVTAGALIKIEKVENWTGNRRSVDFRIKKVAGAADVQATAPRVKDTNELPPNATPATPPPPAPVNGAGENSAAILSRCYHQAIDIALAATAYAETKGLRITPAFEDIRAMAATICINETGGRR